MFFNGFTLLMMIVGGAIGFGLSRLFIDTQYLVERLSARVGYEYDNEGQIVIYTGLYDDEQENRGRGGNRKDIIIHLTVLIHDIIGTDCKLIIDTLVYRETCGKKCRIADVKSFWNINGLGSTCLFRKRTEVFNGTF